jgi:hypothetical protein
MQPRGEVGELLTISSKSTPPTVKPLEQVESIVDYAETVIDNQTDLSRPRFHQLPRPRVLKAAIQMSAIMPQGASLVYDSLAAWAGKIPAVESIFGNDLKTSS